MKFSLDDVRLHKLERELNLQPHFLYTLMNTQLKSIDHVTLVYETSKVIRNLLSAGNKQRAPEITNALFMHSRCSLHAQ